MGVKLEWAEREPCVVCGAPGGNCGPQDGRDDHPGRIMFEEWGGDYVSPEPRRPSVDDYVVTEKIWDKVPIPHSTRTRDVLRYKVGDVIPRAEAIARGLVIPEPPASPSEPEPEPPAVPVSLQKAARAPRVARPARTPAKATGATKKASGARKRT